MRDDFLRRNGIIGGPWSEGGGKSAPGPPDVEAASSETGAKLGAPSWSFVEAGVLRPAWGGLRDLLLGGFEEAVG
jgi:hypothetical protein